MRKQHLHILHIPDVTCHWRDARLLQWQVWVVWHSDFMHSRRKDIGKENQHIKFPSFSLSLCTCQSCQKPKGIHWDGIQQHLLGQYVLWIQTLSSQQPDPTAGRRKEQKHSWKHLMLENSNTQGFRHTGHLLKLLSLQEQTQICQRKQWPGKEFHPSHLRLYIFLLIFFWHSFWNFPCILSPTSFWFRFRDR